MKYLLVLTPIVSITERLITNPTLDGFYIEAVDHPLMVVFVPVLTECLVTELTLEWLLLVVYHFFMPSPAIALTKSLVTKPTLMGLFFAVHCVHMPE